MPSGSARAAIALPMVPPAPPRLSTTIDWPSTSLILSAMIRPTMVVLPPGGNGTISVIGRLG